MEPGINCLAGESAGIKAGRERESRGGERGTILAGGSPNFLSIHCCPKNLILETDVMPRLSPGILCISVLSLNTPGTLEWYAYIYGGKKVLL